MFPDAEAAAAAAGAATTKAQIEAPVGGPVPDGRFMNRYKISIGRGILLGGFLVHALFTINAGAWTLVWADEFDQPDGSAPDPQKWTYDLGRGDHGWGNNELQYYTARTNNARIERGQLIIEAHAESFGGCDYTSARLKTQGLAAWTGGRMEARLRLPHGPGIWPAFWMLGANHDVARWPGCGEIDIMENIGREPDIVHGTIHGPGYSGGDGISGKKVHPDGSRFSDDFHVFAVEWDADRIQWFVDQELFFTVAATDLPAGALWVFTQPQFLLLNVAVGGNWPGRPEATTVFPQRMFVDYVRVYQKR